MPNAGIRFAYRLIEKPSNFAPEASSCYGFESLLLTLVNRMIIPPCTIFGASERYLIRSTAFSLLKANMTMAKQTNSKFVSLGALGLLVIIFGFILFVVAAPLFAPNTGGFVFSVSRRAFIITLVGFLMVVAAAVFFFARALRRRHL